MEEVEQTLRQGLQTLRSLDWHVPQWLRNHFRPARAKAALAISLVISVLWLPGVAFVAFPLVYVAVRLIIATWRASAILAFLAVSVVISLGLMFVFPVIGFVLDGLYWMMLTFVGFLWLLFGRRPA